MRSQIQLLSSINNQLIIEIGCVLWSDVVVIYKFCCFEVFNLR